MNNRDTEATWTYHNGTKHSYESVRTGDHFLDWSNQPLPFKIYSTLDPIPLPQDFARPDMLALNAIAASGSEPTVTQVPDLKTLAGILFFSAGITRRRIYSGGEILFRAAACTGALYHIEIYLVCSDLPDLQAGVYHFGAHDFALRKLRTGDHRGALVKASGGEPSLASAPAILIGTGTFWRNAWKYRSRTYRHCFWDSGTILANLLAATAAFEVPARVICGFLDAQVNRLLDLDVEREVALTLIPLGRDRTSAPAPPSPAGPLLLPTVPLSKTEVDYPAIRAMHAASSLHSESEAADWRGRTPAQEGPPPEGLLFPLCALKDADLPADSIAQVILRRGSTRQFAGEPITFAQLSTMLDRATRGVPADFLEPAGAMINHLYLIVNAVEDLPPGAYIFHQDRQALELLKEGNFRREAGYLGLEQALPAGASVNVYLLSDLAPILEHYGNRGYRAAQLEAGIIGGKLYLSAYAQRLGATGLTFYDDDVTAFFSPHAAGKSVMFLAALGRSAKRGTEK
ncbi:MAG: SagB/ThcOx family dehydrogenase [Candidatus Tectomicrobia bacterium]|uniref:SagB/ThcOx family dehydrogenase n=1 Tax=Tectimicrobiota bacterium TaxID=2528274 RepID=A0A932GQI0_UNCTE|nr:SagB/ThcOx family dehydrogenase [Candidatus Tectomicrobia bacterium]